MQCRPGSVLSWQKTLVQALGRLSPGSTEQRKFGDACVLAEQNSEGGACILAER